MSHGPRRVVATSHAEGGGTEEEMSATRKDDPTEDAGEGRGADHNEVRITGRLSADADVKDLPSGDVLVLLKVVVARPEGNRVDSLPVVVGPGPDRGRRRNVIQASRRTVTRATKLSEGERVTVEGWLKRHFWDAGGARRSRLQVVATEVSRT